MQKGKGLHRGGGRLTRAMRVAIVLGALLAAACRAGAQGLWNDPPFADAPGRLDRSPAAGGRFARLSILAASPYGIEDLAAWRMEIRAGTAFLASGISWRRLAHPLYREDLLAGLVEARLPAAGLRLGAVPVLALRAAEGFDGEGSSGVFAAISWAPCRFLSLRAAVPADGGGPATRGGSWLVASARAGSIRAGLLAHRPDRIERETRVSAAVDLGGDASVESSYAVRAREVSGAFALERRAFRISIAWSVHPALGVGAFAEVERAWAW